MCRCPTTLAKQHASNGMRTILSSAYPADGGKRINNNQAKLLTRIIELDYRVFVSSSHASEYRNFTETASFQATTVADEPVK